MTAPRIPAEATRVSLVKNADITLRPASNEQVTPALDSPLSLEHTDGSDPVALHSAFPETAGTAGTPVRGASGDLGYREQPLGKMDPPLGANPFDEVLAPALERFAGTGSIARHICAYGLDLSSPHPDATSDRISVKELKETNALFGLPKPVTNFTTTSFELSRGLPTQIARLRDVVARDGLRSTLRQVRAGEEKLSFDVQLKYLQASRIRDPEGTEPGIFEDSPEQLDRRIETFKNRYGRITLMSLGRAVLRDKNLSAPRKSFALAEFKLMFDTLGVHSDGKYLTPEEIKWMAKSDQSFIPRMVFANFARERQYAKTPPPAILRAFTSRMLELRASQIADHLTQGDEEQLLRGGGRGFPLVHSENTTLRGSYLQDSGEPGESLTELLAPTVSAVNAELERRGAGLRVTGFSHWHGGNPTLGARLERADAKAP